MPYTRLKLKHGYHDARISAVHYRGRDVVLDVELCSCCNDSPGPASIAFRQVRNLDAVRDALEAARTTSAERGYVDEIIGIVRHADRGIVLDLAAAGGVYVDAHGISES